MMEWWFKIDLGGADKLVSSEGPPDFSGEWTGPFPTFTAAKLALVRAIRAEIQELRQRVEYYMVMSKETLLEELQ